jgi:hypothetical protein
MTMKRFRLSFVRPGYLGGSDTSSFDYLCDDLNEALRHAADCAKPDDIETVRVQEIKDNTIAAFGREYQAISGGSKL